MQQKLIDYLIEALKEKGILFDTGLTNNEISQLENKYGFGFVPDLKAFLQTALPISTKFVNWRKGISSESENETIQSILNWPWDGMKFDLEHSDYWHETWGKKPDDLMQKIKVAKEYFDTYPKLLPIYGHRFMPSLPNEMSNPVLSVYQMDIILYGIDLADYFAGEFGFALPDEYVRPELKHNIYFWGEFLS